MRALPVAVALLVAAAAHAQPPVTTEFRVFVGTEEITASTRLRVMPTGTREQVTTLDRGPRLVTSVPPGIYDVQAFRVQDGGVAAIKWAERLVIMHYPDEGGRHLEVINFLPGYGALQLRAAKGPIAAYDVAVFRAGERGSVAGVVVDGGDYRLFVLEAGRYDIRVRHAGTLDDPQDTHWFLDVEVPADRTRLKQIDVAG